MPKTYPDNISGQWLGRNVQTRTLVLGLDNYLDNVRILF